MAQETPAIPDEQINQDVLRPIMQTDWRFYFVVGVLGVVVLWGIFAFGWQLYWGMGVNGYTHGIFWAMYIINFVFWIGLSHSGTLISAILRVTHAEWRRPITRGAEAMTVLTLSMGALFPIIHVGRNWRIYYVLPYFNERTLWPDFRSPLLWDFAAISTYLTSSLIYLYLPMIPDLALLRDRVPGWRRTLYTVLALGWRGTEREWRRLRRALGLMAFVIIPIAVSVHSIVSWDFAMSIMPGWHSTIFAPYFVIGAIYSGTALVVTIMILLRWVFHLEAYLTHDTFDNLGKVFLAVTILWTYFYFAEFLHLLVRPADGRVPGNYRVDERGLCSLLLPHDRLQLRDPILQPHFQEGAENNSRSLRHLDSGQRGHVHRALPNRGTGPFPCPDPLFVGELGSSMAGNIDFGGDVRRLHPPVHPVYQVLPAPGDLGDKGGADVALNS